MFEGFQDLLDGAPDSGLVRSGRLVRSWSGLYDTTPDWNPVLGRVPGIEGFQVAFGFSGHCFKLPPMIGLEPDLPVDPCRITRFEEGRLLTGAYGMGAVS